MEVVFTCGRLNPPTLGHARLINEVKRTASMTGGTAMVFTTRTHDRDRNPLSPDVKRSMIEEAFDLPVDLTTSPYGALEGLIQQGVRNMTFVVGADRAQQFSGMVAHASKLGATLVLKAIDRSADAISASAVRTAARNNDLDTFCRLTPSPRTGYQEELFRAVSDGLGVRWQ